MKEYLKNSVDSVLEEIVEELKKGKRPFICVRQFDTYVKLFLLNHYSNPLIGNFSGTIQELAIKILQDNLENFRLMSDQERLFVVSEALRRCGDRHHENLSYVKIVDERLRNLKEHSFDHKRLEALSKEIESKKLGWKIEQTAKIMKTYDLLAELSGALDIFTLLERAKGKPCQFDTIYLFLLPQILPKEIEFLKSLKKQVKVIIPEQSNEFFSKLTSDNISILPENWEIIKLKSHDVALNFALKPKEIENIDIKITGTSFNTRSEGVKIAVNCVKRILSEGIEPHRIAITGRNIEGLEVLFYEMFKKDGIPVMFQTKGMPLLSHPVIKSFLNTLDFSDDEIKKEETPTTINAEVLRLIKENQELTLSEWLNLLMKAFNTSEEDESIKDQIRKLSNELKNLQTRGILKTEKVNKKSLKERLQLLFSNRFYLIRENEPFGVYICSPESVPSINPKALIIFDISEGIYPRAFPYDPDFSFYERELISKKVAEENLILEPFASRKRLISYEFLTFFNMLSSHPKEIVLLYDATKGKSLFLNILSKYAGISEIRRSVFSETSLNCSKVYKDQKEAESLIEKGVSSWIKKIKGEKNYNFIINKEVVKAYLKNISVTDIVSYLDCPTDFMFRKLLNYKDVYSVEACEGIIYHELIKRLSDKGFDEDTFEEVFKETVKATKNREIAYLKPFIRENIKKFLSIFREDNLFSENALKEKNLSVRILDYCLEGRADWIVKDQNGNYQVVDFKRGAVKSNDYTPGKKKACQVILYGLSLFENGDVIKALKKGNLKNLGFHFISIPKISKAGSSWKQSFNGEENKEFIKKNLSWTYLTLKLINSGFFIPYEIVPYRKPFRGKLFSLKRRGRCENYECYLSQNVINEFETKIEQKLKEIEEKLF